ncbi:Anaphase-promoting complex subunit 13 [Elsinoe australis]|uniref:Anaphase-promoting complex subunit 13 n=1 Tax=Elsinoe australis TaxID=40998 RepID=A0A2P7Z4I1_9PEZI|nr:Anaphase-promoting complex subunit 13 [Elsinoe australis]
MARDSSHTYIHLHKSHHADLLEDFTRTNLAPEEILVPPQHQPLNPEDEDDVVPNEHAAFGIQRATQRQKEPVWRDLGLDRIMTEGPPKKANGESRAKKAGEIRTIR